MNCLFAKYSSLPTLLFSEAKSLLLRGDCSPLMLKIAALLALLFASPKILIFKTYL